MTEMVGPERRPDLQSPKPMICIANEPNLGEVINEDNCIDLGYYLHRNKLGEGGFGKVRLATHLRTGHKVAVKIMNKQKLGADLCRVRVEINSLKVLKHENIAKLLQVIETESEIYLILEYCSGGELFDYLVSKNRLSENESKIIMKDLFNALAFIHRKGFAHRDLKPENILFDDKHRIKLIDFGLAANCRDNNNSLSHLSTCCGSPAYAAPELLYGADYSGPAVDVWSAGVLCYALLVGRLPFDDDNIGLLYKKIQSGIFRMPDWLSIAAKDLIRSMLTTDPNARITIDKILSHQWFGTPTDVVNRSIQILNSNLDEEVFYKCHRLFPETPIKQLRTNVMLGFGYQTASYWLIKMNGNSIAPSKISAIKSPLNKTAIEGKLNKSLNDALENNNRPKLKRKLIETQNNENPNPFDPKRFNVLAPKIIFDINSKIPVPLNSPKLTPNAKETRKLKEIKSPLNSPVVPPKRARLFIGLNENTDNKSPVWDRHLKPCSPKTPMNVKSENTPKKSLLKRFLETATPAKSLTPRSITTSTTSKNITLTNFIEPQKCIQKLIQTLTAKGIQCKQKDFSLRCVLSTKNVIILSFNLEILRFDNRCVIQRKRLKGDAWNYKKVCEEILRISNE